MISKKTSTRAESVVLSYILVLGIMTVLSTLLIAASSGYLQTKHQDVTETQAEITVEAIASEVEEVDKLARKVDANSTSDGTITYRSQADKLIGQYPYKVYFKSHPRPDTYTVVVTVSSRQVDVTESANVTLYDINDIETGVNTTGSRLTYKYRANGTLTFDTTQEICAIDTDGSYSIPSGETIDGCIIANSSVGGGEDSTVYGDITSEGNEVNLNNNVTVIGGISAASEVNLNDGSTIAGVIESGGNLYIGQNSRIGDSAYADSDIQTVANVSFSGDVDSNNDVTLGVGNNVSGDVIADSSVSIDRNSIVKGGIRTGTGNIDLARNVTVKGETISGNDMTVGRNGNIESNITTNAITVENASKVNATIDGDTVYLKDNVKVSEDVIVPNGSALSCGLNVTINGQSCSDYKDANY